MVNFINVLNAATVFLVKPDEWWERVKEISDGCFLCVFVVFKICMYEKKVTLI
jgi:hypothetical protein